MNAQTSYNDCIGQVSADIATERISNSLNDVLSRYGFNNENHDIVGLRFFRGMISDDGKYDITIIFKDLQDEERLKKRDVSMSIEEFFSLFEQIDIVLLQDSEGLLENINSTDELESLD